MWANDRIYRHFKHAAQLGGLVLCCTLFTVSMRVKAEDVLTLGYKFYQENCATCHNGSVEEAPTKAALKKLSVDAIEAALTDGIMQSQAAHLSPSQRMEIAKFLGKVPLVALDDSYYCNNRLLKPAESVSNQNKLPVGNTSNWGFGLTNERMITNTTITKDNVSQLELDWIFAVPNVARARSQPAIYGDTIYMGGADASIKAIDAQHGCLNWQFPVEAEVRIAITADVDEYGNAARLYFGDLSGNIYGFDVRAQEILWSFKAVPHPASTITGSPILHEDTVYFPVSSLEIVLAANESYQCCTFRGAVVAVDKVTGRVKWTAYTTDKPALVGENKIGIPRYGPSGAPIWSSPTIDTKRGLLYVGTGENYSRPVTQTSDAIIALSLQTGAREWVQQVTLDDAWNASCGRASQANCPENPGPDFDFGAPPILTVDADGREIIVAGQKSGRVYAFDPDNAGQMLWQKQVGRGGIMGGVHWGMATDQKRLYVPISDTSVYQRDAHKPAKSGLHAVEINTGEAIWSTLTPDNCGDAKWRCSPGLSAAATVIPGVVFSGGLDGVMRAFDAETGRILWSFNSFIKFGDIHGVDAFGGSFDSDGPVILGDRLYITSGYDKWGLQPGNVLLSFKIKSPK